MAGSGVVNTAGMEMEYCRFGNGDRIFVILPRLTDAPPFL